MENIKKVLNIRAFIYAFLIWLNLNISGIQKIYFSEGETLTVIIVKILHLLFLYAILAKIHKLFTERHTPKGKKEIVISIIYLIILTILVILVWPGIWSTDDTSVLKNAESYVFTPWQHFFSGLFQTLCLQTIPIPSGVIIVQIIIASLIVGYCISNISTLFGKTEKQQKILEIVLFLILLLPPLVSYILSGFRMGLYSYLEMALITKLIILCKEQKKITISELLKICFLTIIISCWRSEGIYYPFIILIIFLVMKNKIIRKRVAIITFLIVMIINVSIGKLNNYFIETNNYAHHPTMRYNDYNNPIMKSNNYSITATMEPVTQLIRSSNESDKEEIDTIDKVVDVKYILEHPEKTGEGNFWIEGVVRDYSEEEYFNYLKAYLKLALKYPDITFKSMWDIFEKAGSGMGYRNKQTTRNAVSGKGTLYLFEVGSNSWMRWTAVTSKVAKYKQPINSNVRNAVIRFLNGTDSNDKLTIIHNICWNFFIPFILILICLIYKLFKKDWFMVFIILAIVARIPLVFVTAPAPYFMYYLSTYLCSYIISAIVIFEIAVKEKSEKTKEIFNVRTFLYTFLIWFCLNISGIQEIFFDEYKNFVAMIIKILHFVFLYIIIAKIRLLYIKRHIPKVKKEIIISIIYFLILTLLLILVWPGIWNVDNIEVLNNIEKYKITKGHFFSSIFQMLCLQTIPIPSGVIIMQVLIASLIVGYSISNIPVLLGKNKKQEIIIQIALWLIVLSPFMLMYIISGSGTAIGNTMETLDLYTINSNVWVKWNAVTSKVGRYKLPININVRNNVISFFNKEMNLICVVCVCVAILAILLYFFIGKLKKEKNGASKELAIYGEKNKNIKAIIYGCLIWAILNVSGIQNAYFYGGKIIMTIVVKILHLLFVNVITYKIYSLYQNRKNPEAKNEIIISLICFSVLIILLLLVWPGIWSWDDITILRNAAAFNLTPWHHFFSGLFQILCLQTIPIPAGVMIIQSLIASLIIGYCVTNISELYSKSKKTKIVLQIILGLICLFPPLVMYILSGFRMGIYSYLELLLITKMIILYKNKEQATRYDIIKISLLTIIISCWRTEGFYYPICILLLYLIMGNKIIRKKVAIAVSLVIMIISFSIGKINNLMIGNNEYSLTATMEPVTALVKNSNESDKEEIDKINQVIDVQYVLENPEKTGELYYWTTGVVKDYSKEQYSDYLKAYLKLALKYPNIAFKSMWNIFVRAGSGFGEDSKQTTKNMTANTGGQAVDLFDVSTMANTRWNSISVADLRAKRAINIDVRNSVILFLNGTDSDGKLTIIHNIFWNFFIPFILIFGCLIYKLVKKDWFMVFLILTVVIRIPIVFVTAPAEYFMYYLSAYLCTYIISVTVIFDTLKTIKEEKRGQLCKKES